jgi:GlpG protein
VRTEFQRAPVTVALGALCLLLYPFLGNAAETVGPVLSALLIVPVVPHGNLIAFPSLSATLEAGHLWRLWTPALVHFSALHLVFNSLWLWEFGRRIEGQEGSGRLLEGLLWLAPASALAQYAVGEHPLFGGLSGVVYGLLGYLVVVQRLRPRRAYRLPPALPVLLIGLLALMATGVTEPFGLAVANGAHLGGLLAGGLWGFARALWPGAGVARGKA